MKAAYEGVEDALDVCIAASQAVMVEAFSRYGVDEMALAFNGGKDCCVVLHLLHMHYPDALQRIQVVHFVDPDEFPEITAFVEGARIHYNLPSQGWHLIPATSVKQGLELFKERAPHIRMFFHGRRSTDPYAHLESEFTPSTKGWPEFMRVAPILSWDYHTVWQFLLKYKVPYPSLCKFPFSFLFFMGFLILLLVADDEGYTSLGSRKATIPNKVLKDPEGGYYPAYALRDAKDERLSRVE